MKKKLLTEEEIKEAKDLLGLNRSYFYDINGEVDLHYITWEDVMRYYRTGWYAPTKKIAKIIFGRDWDY